ncbi:hypothetical protein FQZ97_764520 [compost metagenome]
MQQYGELVATQAERQVGLAQAATQAIGHGDEQLVADVVAVAVVHILEVVEVDEQQCGHLRFPVRPVQVGFQLLLEGLAVAQSGERVAVGHVQQLALVGHLLADVAQDAAEADDLPAARAEDRREGGVHPARAAIAALQRCAEGKLPPLQ